MRDDGAYCPNCGWRRGTAVQPPPPVVPPSAYQYYPPPVRKESPHALIIAVVAVMVLLIVSGVAAMVLNGMVRDDGTDGGGDLYEDYHLSMEVSGVKGYHSQSISYQPAEGFIHVIVYANLTNQGPDTAWLSMSFLALICSDGNRYEHEYFVEVSISGYLHPGEAMAMFGGYEIPEGVAPTSLTYDDGKESVSVSIPPSTVDLSFPHYAVIDVLSVVDGEDDPFDSDLTYVIVTVQFTNLLNRVLDMRGNYFDLETSGGMSYDYHYHSDATVPDGVQAEATVTFAVMFKIPKTATPTVLVYYDRIDRERVMI